MRREPGFEVVGVRDILAPIFPGSEGFLVVLLLKLGA